MLFAKQPPDTASYLFVGIIVFGWGIYGVLSYCVLSVSRRWLFHVFFAILLTLLALNAAGCRTVIGDRAWTGTLP